MNEMIPGEIHKTKRLHSGEYFDLFFNVIRPVEIVLFSTSDTGMGRWRGTGPLGDPTPEPARQKLELFKPGGSEPVANSSGYGLAGLRYDVLGEESRIEGEWGARITNIGEITARFSLQVIYYIEEKTFTVPANLVEKMFNSTIGKTRIHITDGRNASYIDFPDSLDVPNQNFTIRNFRKTIKILWIKIVIRERVNNIDSSDLNFTLQNATRGYSNGFIRFVIRFEESGNEILGTWSGNMRNMALSIDLGLEVFDNKISYNKDTIRVVFAFDLNMSGLSDTLFDPIFGYSQNIKRKVEQTVRRIFEREAMRNAFSNAITSPIFTLLGSNPQILSVSIEGNQLNIRYYNV